MGRLTLVTYLRLLGALALGWTGVAGAQLADSQSAPKTLLSVSVDVPAECPDRNSLELELERLLGEAGSRGMPLEAKVRVDKPTSESFRLRLGLKQSGRSSERTLSGASCDTLMETAALLIAIAHDPSAVVERKPAPVIPQVASSEPPPARSAMVPPPPAPSPPAWSWTMPVAPPEPLELGLLLRAGPLLGVGDLADPHAGFAIAAALRVEAFRIETAFELGAGSTETIDERPNAGADFIRLSGVLRGCRAIWPFDGGRWPRAPLALDLAGCVGIELGTLSGEGFGVTSPERGTALWAAPRVDLRLGLGIAGPLGVAADLGLAIPVDPRRYVLRGGESASVLVVHEPSAVAGRAGILAEIEL